MEQPDHLILEMQNGNEKAFAKIYDDYSEAIYGIIYSIVLNEEIAQEILQDVFVKVWDNSKAYNKSKGRFFTWILNIARNASIDQLRSKAHKKSKKNLNASDFVDIIVSTENLNKKTDTIGIKKFIEVLKPACRKIIDLLFFKGFTQADAAKQLEIPIGTLKTRNRACLRELRQIVVK